MNYSEKDLGKIIKKYFLENGYTVRSEVNDCDVVIENNGLISIIEIKKKINFDLILQAIKRQRLSEIVYICIEKNSIKSKKWNDYIYLLRRLELGLILIDIEKDESVLFYQHPKSFSRKHSFTRSKKRREKLLQEFYNRSIDYNTGGSVREKILTQYKEDSLYIVYLLKKYKQLSLKELRDLGANAKKCSSILQNNFYKFFERVSRGVYKSSNKGEESLKKYDFLIKYFEEKEISIKD